jgi:hypothetical protein
MFYNKVNMINTIASPPLAPLARGLQPRRAAAPPAGTPRRGAAVRAGPSAGESDAGAIDDAAFRSMSPAARQVFKEVRAAPPPRRPAAARLIAATAAARLIAATAAARLIAATAASALRMAARLDISPAIADLRHCRRPRTS